jgi:hypothetical protein
MLIPILEISMAGVTIFIALPNAGPSLIAPKSFVALSDPAERWL